MRATVFALALLGAIAIPSLSLALIPGTPRIIAGIDDISPKNLGEVLSRFCKENDCKAQLDWHENDNYNWNFYWNDGRTPVSVGGTCTRIHHHYCIQTWGVEGRAFMNDERTLELKKMLEAKGAKVVLMDCSIGGTDGFRYVCTNGKPPP